MGNDKSILQKIADTVKDIANIATDAANDALKAEAPPKPEEAVVTYVPLAGEGLVSDPMMVPSSALGPAQKKKPAAAKPATKKIVGTTAKKSAKKPAVGKARTTAEETVKKPPKKTKSRARA